MTPRERVSISSGRLKNMIECPTNLAALSIANGLIPGINMKEGSLRVDVVGTMVIITANQYHQPHEVHKLAVNAAIKAGFDVN